MNRSLKVKRIYTVEDLGDFLRDKRKRTGKSLEQVAQNVGISKQYLSMIENQTITGELSETLLLSIERVLNKALKEQETARKKNVSGLVNDSRITG